MNMNVRKAQGGFTLIELVIVIVLLGIIAAVALPRYIDLTDQAEAATCDGIQGALASTGAILIADPDFGESAAGEADGIGTPGTMEDIGNQTIQDGWVIDATDAGACQFTIELDNGTQCERTIDDSLASDC